MLKSELDSETFILNFGTIAACMFVFGFFHKSIVSPKARKWSATFLGLIVISVLFGEHTWRYMFVNISSIALIKIVGWRMCHLTTLILQLVNISIIRITEPSVGYNNRLAMDNIVMSTLIKFVSVAYDIHIANRNKMDGKGKTPGTKSLNCTEEESLNPSFMDLFHYTSSFIGNITCPFIRFRTYYDYIHLPFARSSKPCKGFIKRQILTVCMFSVGYLLLTYFTPLEYIATKEFREQNFLFKTILNISYSLQHIILCLIGVTSTSQSVYCIVGIGAYPTSLKSAVGHGPTVDYSNLKNITREEADKLEYDFETIDFGNLPDALSSPWVGYFCKRWNRTIQYFMWKYIHKEFLGNIFKSTDIKIIVTLLFSAFWHGLDIGWYTCLIFTGLIIISEKPYYTIYPRLSGWVSYVYLVMISLVNISIFSHIMVSPPVLHKNALIHAKAMNYVPYIILLGHYLVGRVISSFDKKCE